MANNWGREIAVIQITESTSLHVQRDAELNGAKFLVLSKFVKTSKYDGPAKGGTLMIPNAKLAELKAAVCGLLE
jgi:hypothetical protein